MARKSVRKEVKKEFKELNKNRGKILTVPTLLNTVRILLTFVVAYLIIVEYSVIWIVTIFSIAALTDWFDGKIARKYNLVNSFGAKADMTADRFLWIGTALVFFIVYGIREQIDSTHGIQLLLIMIREIVSAPSAIVAMFLNKGFPRARYVAKITTFLQGFAMPALILSVFYPAWGYLSVPLSIAVGIFGIVSGFYYIYDVQRIEEGKK
ncbi:MAG: CDP-alcohol phosphatidyltransferase family protein [Nanoarchaeota archaeon]|nr:CDP-alcohol phosphatidyltransferase family protein [Nanoarchaeota archaeon]